MLPRTIQDTHVGVDSSNPVSSSSVQSIGSQGHPREYDGSTSEILGNTSDCTIHFSSTSVPSDCSLTSSDGLPFGFIISPFSATIDSSRWLRRAPERCQTCGAYRNLYIVVEIMTGRWACNFCGGINSSEDLKSKEAIEDCRYSLWSVACDRFFVACHFQPRHLI